MHDLTAAHRTLPFGTQVRVTRRDTRARVEVRINDRGPFIQGRIIDLSYEAARRIGLDVDGVAPVSVVIIGRSRVRAGPPPKTDAVEVNECFWVQVGAFGDAANAERNVARLKDSGERAVMIEGPQGLKRVRVGPFSQRGEAETARERLLSDWPVAKVVECGG
jgi:rare lipoprotein A